MRRIIFALLFALAATSTYAATDTARIAGYMSSEVDSIRVVYLYEHDSANTWKWTGNSYVDTFIAVADDKHHEWELVYWFAGEAYPANDLAFYSKARNSTTDSIWFKPRLRVAEQTDSIERYIFVGSDSTLDTTATGVYSIIDSVHLQDTLFATIRYLLYYTGEPEPQPYDIYYIPSSVASGTVYDTIYAPEPPSGTYMCRVWGYVYKPNTGTGLRNASVYFTLPDKNNSCDSSIFTQTTVKAIGTDATGYFYADLPWSSCMGDLEYGVKVRSRYGEREYQITVPDSTTYRLIW